MLNIKMKPQKKQLLDWYSANKRDLPWRNTRDPYSIWISEVMLQQTTVKAVIPFYEKFIKRFPSVTSLAQASLEEIYEYWAGLGYYSRARNLHKAAQLIDFSGFPQNYSQFIKLPGFGPYTSRAVSSFAFKETVGVLDGNVIRFLCRHNGFKFSWWETKNKNVLQTLVDKWVEGVDSSIMNQALIEIGATLCTPQSPSCILCPLKNSCVSFNNNTQEKIPLKKPRKKLEIWIWEPHILEKNKKLALVKNSYAPFLKGQMIFPGLVKTQKNIPKKYNYKHNITHHEIYVQIKRLKSTKTKGPLKWVDKKQIVKINPVSLIQKALQYI